MAWVWLLAAVAAAELVPNGGFEPPYRDGLAAGWEQNCYGSYEVRFEPDYENAHSGRACQKIVCTDFKKGGVQIRCRGISVRQGQVYTLSAWLRAEGITSRVLVIVRKHAWPYTRYLFVEAKPGPEWRRFTVVAKAAGSDPDCGIYVWFGSTGTLWVDDVSLVEGEHWPQTPGVDKLPVKGNRIYNSSFELGEAGWSGGEIVEGGMDRGRCLKLQPGRFACSRPFAVTPGQLYTVSFWARAPKQAAIRAEMVEMVGRGGDRPEGRHSRVVWFAAGEQWQRHSFRVVAEAFHTNGYLLRLSSTKGEAFVDQVQVEEGKLSQWAPSAPVELAFELAPAKRYPEPGQAIEPVLRLWAPRFERRRLQVQLRWRDIFGRSRPAGSAAVDVNRRGLGSAKVRATPPGDGIWRLEASGPGKCAGAELVVGVLPPPEQERRPESFFGVHCQTRPGPGNLAVEVAWRAGARWYRLHDFNNHVQWRHCNPQPGVFRWFDEEILDLHKRGYMILGTLVRTPKWAGRKPEGGSGRTPYTAYVPKQMAWYGEFVRRAAERYRGVVDCWEMWNEPYGRGFWAGTPEEYVELERVGYQAAKAANPACKVVGLCVYPGYRKWVERVAAAGGFKWLDIVSFHVYLSPGLVAVSPERGSSRLEEFVGYLRQVARRHGRGGVRIWDSEGGVPCPPFYSWLPRVHPRWAWIEAAATVAKAVAQLRMAGVEKWFYYFCGYPHGGPGDWFRVLNFSYILMDVDGSPKPTMLAWAAAARMLDGARVHRKILRGTAVAYVFQRGGGAVAVVWSEKGGRRIRLPRPVAVVDVVGRPAGKAADVEVGEVPVYLLFDADAAAAGQWLEQALGGR